LFGIYQRSIKVIVYKVMVWWHLGFFHIFIYYDYDYDYDYNVGDYNIMTIFLLVMLGIAGLCIADCIYIIHKLNRELRIRGRMYGGGGFHMHHSGSNIDIKECNIKECIFRDKCPYIKKDEV